VNQIRVEISTLDDDSQGPFMSLLFFDDVYRIFSALGALAVEDLFLDRDRGLNSFINLRFLITLG
jgi:hypothetical protein